MRIRVLVFGVLAALWVMPASAQLLPIPPGWQLERAVLLSRHGVRAPLQANDEMDRFAATPWPAWSVQPGFLTPHGAELLRLMGRYYRVLYGGRGLIEADDCPPPNTVAAWTDLDQRTRNSAAALMTGMYPRCATPYVRNQDDPSVPDPLFHPPPTASCPMDPAADRAALLARIGGNFDSVLREYGPQLKLAQDALCPPRAAGSRACGLTSAPAAVTVGERNRLRLTGPIGIGSLVGETFVMEDADGMLPAQVAWGRLTAARLEEVLQIHRLELDLTEKTLEIARERGSNLLAQISTTLQDGHKFPGLPNLAEPVRLALLVGHDSNIANVMRLLNLSWQIPGLQPNDPSPGGALAFELYRDSRSGRRYVRLAYYAQTPEQMRQSTVLEAVRPPGMVAVALPACEASLYEKSCPLERFVQIAKEATQPACVTIKP
jgi:4-phytase/acid phosphatase